MFNDMKRLGSTCIESKSPLHHIHTKGDTGLQMILLLFLIEVFHEFHHAIFRCLYHVQQQDWVDNVVRPVHNIFQKS